LANNEIGPEGCEYLAQALENNKYLKVLVLNHNPIEDDVSIFICSMTKYPLMYVNPLSLSLSLTKGVSSLASSAKSSVLRDLKITQCKLSDDGAVMIGNLMGADGSQLQVLDLGLNGISDAGAIAIAEGLGRNTHMTTLMLTGAYTHTRIISSLEIILVLACTVYIVVC
jgi:Ran GTPase-activating protein (RanGAP) involved in mRNA processing and transport